MQAKLCGRHVGVLAVALLAAAVAAVAAAGTSTSGALHCAVGRLQEHWAVLR